MNKDNAMGYLEKSLEKALEDSKSEKLCKQISEDLVRVY